MSLRALDYHFLNANARTELTGLWRAIVEFWYFGIKQVRACLFVGLFFAAVFAVPRAGILAIPRYDVLLVMLWAFKRG